MKERFESVVAFSSIGAFVLLALAFGLFFTIFIVESMVDSRTLAAFLEALFVACLGGGLLLGSYAVSCSVFDTAPAQVGRRQAGLLATVVVTGKHLLCWILLVATFHRFYTHIRLASTPELIEKGSFGLWFAATVMPWALGIAAEVLLRCRELFVHIRRAKARQRAELGALHFISDVRVALARRDTIDDSSVYAKYSQSCERSPYPLLTQDAFFQLLDQSRFEIRRRAITAFLDQYHSFFPIDEVVFRKLHAPYCRHANLSDKPAMLEKEFVELLCGLATEAASAFLGRTDRSTLEQLDYEAYLRWCRDQGVACCILENAFKKKRENRLKHLTEQEAALQRRCTELFRRNVHRIHDWIHARIDGGCAWKPFLDQPVEDVLRRYLKETKDAGFYDWGEKLSGLREWNRKLDAEILCHLRTSIPAIYSYYYTLELKRREEGRRKQLEFYRDLHNRGMRPW